LNQESPAFGHGECQSNIVQESIKAHVQFSAGEITKTQQFIQEHCNQFPLLIEVMYLAPLRQLIEYNRHKPKQLSWTTQVFRLAVKIVETKLIFHSA
jgi:hypothetical protein